MGQYSIEVFFADNRPEYSEKLYKIYKEIKKNIPIVNSLSYYYQPSKNMRIFPEGLPIFDESKEEMSGEKYSSMVLNLLPYVVDENATHIMIIQADGYPINYGTWTDDYLEYDYIGAPWKLHPHHYWPPFPNVTTENRVGNGGFSIRSVALAKEAAELSVEYVKSRPGHLHPEDCFICREVGPKLKQKGYKFAPYDLAKQFSCENEIYTNQFGFHGKSTISMNKGLIKLD